MSKERRFGWHFLVLCGLFLAGFAQAQESAGLENRIGDQKRQLAQMRAELEAGRARVRQLQAQSANAAQSLAQVEANLRLQQQLVSQLDSTEALYRTLVENSAQERAVALQQWSQRQRLLSARVREMYVHRRRDPARAWIGQRDPLVWLRTLTNLRAIVRTDERLLAQVQEKAQKARHMLELHRTRMAGLDEIAQQRKTELVALEQKQQEEKQSLLTLQEKESAERSRLEQLEAAQATLGRILADLERRRRQQELEQKAAEEKARKVAEEANRKAKEKARREAEAYEKAQRKHQQEVERQRKAGNTVAIAPPPPPPPPPPPVKVAPVKPTIEAVTGTPPARNGLCWPVRGPILSRFGLSKNAMLGTVTRNLGVEIGGKAGQRVVAAASGRVAAVTKLPGRGTTVILEHPGGYLSIYAQLDRTSVSTGASVSSCSDLGTLASGDPPSVYFEYRHNLNAEDPLQWLTR